VPRPEPLQDAGVKAHCHRPFNGAVQAAAKRVLPEGDFRRIWIGEIGIAASRRAAFSPAMSFLTILIQNIAMSPKTPSPQPSPST
jgi:hypothetical protein